MGRSGLDFAQPDYFVLLRTQSTNNTVGSHNHNEFQPPHQKHLHTQILTPFLPPFHMSGNSCFGVHAHRAGKPQKQSRVVEQADMSLSGQECTEREERGVFDQGEKHLSPLS